MTQNFRRRVSHIVVVFSIQDSPEVVVASSPRLRRRSSDQLDADDVFDAERDLLRGRGLHRRGAGQLRMPEPQVCYLGMLEIQKYGDSCPRGMV